MKDADFQNLLQGIREACSYLRGNKKAAARIDHIDPESVAAIRAKLHLSQTEFSTAFGIAPPRYATGNKAAASQRVPPASSSALPPNTPRPCSKPCVKLTKLA
jgi:hypothetical protein